MQLHYDYNEVKKELNYPSSMDFSLALFAPITKATAAKLCAVKDPRIEDPTVWEARDKKYISKLYDEIEMNLRKLERNPVKRARMECNRQIADAKALIRILETKTYVDTTEIPSVL